MRPKEADRPAMPRTRRAALAAALMATVAAGGCERESRPESGAADGDSAGVTIRDSAGVKIVENHAPQHPAGQFWTVDPEPVIVIGGQEGAEGAVTDSAHLIWEVAGLAGLADGRVAVLSGGHSKLFLFERSGKFSTSIGRRGEGPGEFSRPTSLQYLPGDTLVVWDRGYRPVSYFDTTGSLVRQRSIDVGSLMSTIGHENATEGSIPLADGSFVARVAPRGWDPQRIPLGQVYRPPMEFVRIDADYAAHSFGPWGGLEQAWLEEGGRRTAVMPLFRAPISIAGGGRPLSIYVSDGNENEIHQFSPEGVLVRVIRLTTDRVPISDERREEALELKCGLRNLRRRGPNPGARKAACERRMESLPRREYWPSVSFLKVDEEGYLWVATPGGWSVFSPEGRWLGVVDLKRNAGWIGEELILGMSWDDDFVESVRGYRLARHPR